MDQCFVLLRTVWKKCAIVATLLWVKLWTLWCIHYVYERSSNYGSVRNVTLLWCYTTVYFIAENLLTQLKWKCKWIKTSGTDCDNCQVNTFSLWVIRCKKFKPWLQIIKWYEVCGFGSLMKNRLFNANTLTRRNVTKLLIEAQQPRLNMPLKQ